MIELRRLHHVALAVDDLDAASRRWTLEFGLLVSETGPDRALLVCDDGAPAVELLTDGREPGLDHVAWELSRDCRLEDARAHLDGIGVANEEVDGGLRLNDLEGNELHLLPYAEPGSRLVPHARPAGNLAVGHPRRLGHVNFLTGRIHDQVRFYGEALGMRLTDWLGDGGAWLRLSYEHHEMALVDKGYSHFHHLAFDVVDIGQMRAALDHLGRHGRWLGWGPTRHGVGGNIASYVRIVEEACFVELYCDMEKIAADHEPRIWPDDRYSSNTWGPLPPRSYFRFDQAAIDSERASLEMLGQPLDDVPGAPR
ncbi:MAG: VOC family protein [Actinobacteria bacterium]|nr:VOC family protein [Actinomycetota bacterium]